MERRLLTLGRVNRLLLATNNPGKVREFRRLLEGAPFAVVTPGEAGISLDVEETGASYRENALLKALAKRLSELKEEFYTLSFSTGATRADSWIDIDGGIGTLFAYASRGVRELPNSQVFVDGDVEPLSKTGSFIGQHICVPREGAALHINAFNFPVWGMLEKLAPTLLAGVPAIVTAADSPLSWRSFAVISVSVTLIAVPMAASSASSSENARPASENATVPEPDAAVQ